MNSYLCADILEKVRFFGADIKVIVGEPLKTQLQNYEWMLGK